MVGLLVESTTIQSTRRLKEDRDPLNVDMEMVLCNLGIYRVLIGENRDLSAHSRSMDTESKSFATNNSFITVHH